MEEVSVLEDFSGSLKYASEYEKIKKLLEQDLSEQDFWPQAAAISKTIAYYMLKERYYQSDPRQFETSLNLLELPPEDKVILDTLNLNVVERHHSQIRELEKLNLPEQEFYLRAAQINVNLTHGLIYEKYVSTDFDRYQSLCHLIGINISNFFPILRKIANSSRNIPSRDRGCESSAFI